MQDGRESKITDPSGDHMAVGDPLSTRYDGIKCGRVPTLPKGTLNSPNFAKGAIPVTAHKLSPHGCWLAEPSHCGCGSGCPVWGSAPAGGEEPAVGSELCEPGPAFKPSFLAQPVSWHRVTLAHLYLLGWCLRSSRSEHI